MIDSYNNDDIIGRECRFTVHLPKKDDRPDTHFVREILHHKDGRKIPNIRYLVDYKVPFWITKKKYKNHRDKKEYEELSRVDQFFSTVSDLAGNIAVKLGMSNKKKYYLRQVKNSQYVYGIDVSSEVHIKNGYRKLWPDAYARATVATLDIETNIFSENSETVIISISTAESVRLIYDVSIMKDVPDHEEVTVALFLEYIKPKYEAMYEKITKSKIDLQYNITSVRNEKELILEAFEYAHSLRTDFLAIWNIGYDLPKLMEACDRNGLKHTDVFCDPSVPEKNRFFEYVPGLDSKVTSSGGFKPKGFQEIWNYARCTSFFFFIDQASVYYVKRLGAKTIPSGYGLDSMLKLTLGEDAGKIKFIDKIPTNLIKSDWHKLMLSKHPAEYAVYNAWDTAPMNLLDLQTGDLSSFTHISVRSSTLEHFASNPKKIVDKLHEFYINLGKVFGCRPSVFPEDSTLGRDGWIMQLLPANMKEGVTVDVLDASTDTAFTSTTRGYVFDLDQVSAYPSNAEACNISKATTVTEVLEVHDCDVEFYKKETMNTFSGVVNITEFTSNMYNLPSIKDMLDMYEKEIMKK